MVGAKANASIEKDISKGEEQREHASSIDMEGLAAGKDDFLHLLHVPA